MIRYSIFLCVCRQKDYEIVFKSHGIEQFTGKEDATWNTNLSISLLFMQASYNTYLLAPKLKPPDSPVLAGALAGDPKENDIFTVFHFYFTDYGITTLAIKLIQERKWCKLSHRSHFFKF